MDLSSLRDSFTLWLNLEGCTGMEEDLAIPKKLKMNLLGFTGPLCIANHTNL